MCIRDSPETLVPTRDENSNGTFLASIAGGSRVNGERFSGAAPGCTFGVVKRKEAKDYLKEFYLSLIHISWRSFLSE